MSEMNDAKVLIIEDDSEGLRATTSFLRQHFKMVNSASSPDNIKAMLASENYDIILLNMNFHHGSVGETESFYWLGRIIEIDPLAVVILITGYGQIEQAVEGIREGATNFILKPWDDKKLLATITANLYVRQSKLELDELRSKQKALIAQQNQAFGDITGDSAATRKVITLVEQASLNDANVLIQGENGTGKELIARTIHRNSARRNEVFISIDLGAISVDKMERELFGFSKKAGADTMEDSAGRFEAANKGTLFIDEIANMPVSLQSKFLGVIQSRKLLRIGTNREIQLDFRLICASSVPLHEMVNEHKFRKDLLNRINMMEIHMPALRERIEDLPALAGHFLRIYCKKYKMPLKRISPTTMKRLEKHTWPGNIRELQQAIERAVIMSDSNILEPHNFFLPQLEEQSPGNLSISSMNLEENEKMLIRMVYEKHGRNISKAAGELGLTRASLYRRIEKYGLS